MTHVNDILDRFKLPPLPSPAVVTALTVTQSYYTYRRRDVDEAGVLGDAEATRSWDISDDYSEGSDIIEAWKWTGMTDSFSYRLYDVTVRAVCGGQELVANESWGWCLNE